LAITRPGGTPAPGTQAEALAAVPGPRQTCLVANVRLPIPIPAFRVHGRFSQLSARSGLLRDKGPRSRGTGAGRLVRQIDFSNWLWGRPFIAHKPLAGHAARW